MMDKPNTPLTISDNNVPAILRVCSEEKDPNLQDVTEHNKSNYLREQYWIKQSEPTKRWKNRNFINCSGHTKLRTTGLERKLDDPGDAFYELFLSTHRHIIYLRTWFEATEVFLEDKQAEKVDKFIRKYNGLRGNGEIEAEEFLRSLDLGPPDSYMQHKMADKVILAIEKKSQKGQEGSSYKPLVRDYGRGQLIIGLPLWFATLPSNPTTPSNVHKDFATRLLFAFKEIEDSVLRTSWCPFDSVVVLWNPMPESINAWLKAANTDFYLDPANISLKTPISHLKMHSFFKKHNISALIKYHARWDRYPSFEAMIATQRRWLRFPNNPRPLGPKACLKIIDSDNGVSALRLSFFKYLIQLWLFVRLHGWRGLRRRVASRFSVRRLYTRLRQSQQARKLYRSSSSNSSKSED